MDYVVFGIGFGATILVMGLLLRDLGPRLRYRNQEGDDVLPADKLVARISWDRFCRALGAVLAISGSLFIVATSVCILLMVSDNTGGWVMVSALGVFFLLMLYWTWAFFDRFGSYGILPERPAAEETSLRSSPDPQVAADDADAVSDDMVTIIGPVPEELENRDDQAGEEDIPTPEERIERMETPTQHGSAAGDLDTSEVVPTRQHDDRHDRDADEDDASENEYQTETDDDSPASESSQVDATGADDSEEPVDDAESRRNAEDAGNS